MHKKTPYYVLKEEEIFDWIISKMENSYLFLYMLVKTTFENDEFMGLYQEYFKNQTIVNVKTIHDKISEKSISIGRKDSQWSMQMTKYCMLILGYANCGKTVTRTLNVKNQDITIKDISINLPGKRTKEQYRDKNNAYLDTFSKEYVQQFLDNNLLIDVTRNKPIISNYNVYLDFIEKVDQNIKLLDRNKKMKEFSTIVLREKKFIKLTESKIGSEKKRILTAKKTDFESLNRKKTEIGDLGEKLVFEREKDKLKNTQYKPIHVSKTNDTLGYDIKSYEIDGTEIYIEVKTQIKNTLESGEFYLSANEKTELENNPNYVIYFVAVGKTSEFIQIRKKDLKDFSFETVVYKVKFIID